MKGFVQKWQQARMLIGVAMYVDILKSSSLLSLCLQEKLDMVIGEKGIEYLLSLSSHSEALQTVA